MIELPFPAKILWPNGRGHHMAKHRAFKAHKQWAFNAVLATKTWRHLPNTIHRPPEAPPERVSWSVTFYPKTRHAIDRDNALASLKAYQDGIAAAMGLNDSCFETPTLHFAEPVKGGRVVVSIL